MPCGKWSQRAAVLLDVHSTAPHFLQADQNNFQFVGNLSVIRLGKGRP